MHQKESTETKTQTRKQTWPFYASNSLYCILHFDLKNKIKKHKYVASNQNEKTNKLVFESKLTLSINNQQYKSTFTMKMIANSKDNNYY